jgi:hypothetical protein
LFIPVLRSSKEAAPPTGYTESAIRGGRPMLARADFLAAMLFLSFAIAAPAAADPAAEAEGCIPRSACCIVCYEGQACRDSCIRLDVLCRESQGCACDPASICPDDSGWVDWIFFGVMISLFLTFLLTLPVRQFYRNRRCEQCRSAWAYRPTGNQKEIKRISSFWGEFTDPSFKMTEFRCKKCGAVAWKETYEGWRGGPEGI